MAFEANTVLEAIVYYEANGQHMMNVVHYKPGVLGVGPVPLLTEHFLTSFQDTAAGTLIAGMAGCMSNACSIYAASAQVIYPTRWAKQIVDVGPVPGGIAQLCRAQNVQLTVTKRGDLGNRHNVGSFHLGGLPVTLYEEGLINQVDFNAELGNLLIGIEWHPISAVDLIEFFPAILNKQKVEGTDPPKYIVTGATNQTRTELQPEIRVMRRRTVGVGI